MEVITQTDKCHYCGEEVPDDQLERRTPLCFCTHVENCHHLACPSCLAKYEELKDTEITFEMMQTVMQRAAEIKGEWAGIPAGEKEGSSAVSTTHLAPHTRTVPRRFLLSCRIVAQLFKLLDHGHEVIVLRSDRNGVR